MNRTRRRRFVYVASIVVGAGALLLALGAGLLTPWQAFAVVLLAVLPSRIVALLWRDLMDARRRFDRGDFNGAVRSAHVFLAALDARPWLQHIGWLAPRAYSNNATSMAHSAAGAAHLAAGRLAAAEGECAQARAADPENPLPVFNLAMVARARGQKEEAARLFEIARELGFQLDLPEGLLHASPGVSARVDPVLHDKPDRS